MIVVVDCGIGNLHSIFKQLLRLGASVMISRTVKDIQDADKLILPGVGNFAHAMKNLYDLNLVSVLTERVLAQKVPILGICLGMQLFGKRSEEGQVDGLGWINAQTKRFILDEKLHLRIPHMGWNSIEIKRTSPFLNGISHDNTFYFVHSYHVACNEPENVAAITSYGIHFTSVIQKDNIYGTQFHPEKSHKCGLQLLKNFMNLP
jgi:glutamine amidotransferase